MKYNIISTVGALILLAMLFVMIDWNCGQMKELRAAYKANSALKNLVSKPGIEIARVDTVEVHDTVEVMSKPKTVTVTKFMRDTVSVMGKDTLFETTAEHEDSLISLTSTVTHTGEVLANKLQYRIKPVPVVKHVVTITERIERANQFSAGAEVMLAGELWIGGTLLWQHRRVGYEIGYGVNPDLAKYYKAGVKFRLF